MGPVPPDGTAPSVFFRFVPGNVKMEPLLATDRMGRWVPEGLPTGGPGTATEMAPPVASPSPLGVAPTLAGTGGKEAEWFATPYELSSDS